MLVGMPELRRDRPRPARRPGSAAPAPPGYAAAVCASPASGRSRSSPGFGHRSRRRPGPLQRPLHAPDPPPPRDGQRAPPSPAATPPARAATRARSRRDQARTNASCTQSWASCRFPHAANVTPTNRRAVCWYRTSNSRSSTPASPVCHIVHTPDGAARLHSGTPAVTSVGGRRVHQMQGAVGQRRRRGERQRERPASAGKRRSPLPTTTGCTSRCSSSSRPSAISERISMTLPLMPRSEPSSALISRSRSAQSAPSTVALPHSADSRVVETTNFGGAAIWSANASPASGAKCSANPT